MPYTTKQWGLWVQPDGPGTATHFLGCHTLDDVATGGGGVKDLIRCFKADGTGWNTLGSTRNPPDPITTGVTTLIEPVADWLERIVEAANCPFPLYINGKSCPPYNVFGGATRWYALETAEIGATGLTGLSHREEDTPSEQSFEISAWPPLLRGRAITVDSITNAETGGLNDITSCSTARCASDCGVAVDACEVLVAGADPDAAAANVQISYDNGSTWAATAVDPWAALATAAVKSLVCFAIDSDTTRILAARDLSAGVVGAVAYSDDYGASWTAVDLASTVAYGAKRGGSMFSLDMYHTWLVVSDAAGASEMFFSDDGGVSWTEQTMPAGVFNAVWFKDANNGMVVGDADAIATTTDGGTTWALATATSGGGDLYTVNENAGGNVWWVGTDDGDIYYSNDHGVTWTIRPFTGSGAGAVYDLEFFTPTVGYMAHSPTAATGILYRTRDGGYTWEAESATVAGELYSVHTCSINQAFAVGEIAPTNSLILKAHD